jgi:hypothetical protein
MRPPAEAASEHERLTVALEHYLAAMSAFHAAFREHESGGVAAAIGDLEAAQDDLHVTHAAIVERLDGNARWLIAAQPSSDD